MTLPYESATSGERALRLIDMAGRTVGKWSVLRRGAGHRWVCRCQCGHESEVGGPQLRGGKSRSCRRCARAGVAVTHGQASVRNGFSHKYRAWIGMLNRVKDSTSPRARWYAGTPLHPAWLASFEAFDADVPDPPSDQHSLDKIKNELGYVPGNVRWATRAEQARNRRSTRLLTDGVRVQCLTDWAREFGISESGLRYRLLVGRTVLEHATESKMLPAIEGPKS